MATLISWHLTKVWHYVAGPSENEIQQQQQQQQQSDKKPPSVHCDIMVVSESSSEDEEICKQQKPIHMDALEEDLRLLCFDIAQYAAAQPHVLGTDKLLRRTEREVLQCLLIWLLQYLVEASFDLFRYLLLGDQLKPWELACIVTMPLLH